MDYGLYKILSPTGDTLLTPQALKNKNRLRSWEYGYDPKYDIIIISKNGTIGEVYEINGVKIALPQAPKLLPKINTNWVRKDYPKDLSRIRTIFDWNKRDNIFKSKWVDYIEQEFNKRERGRKNCLEICR